MFLENLMNNFAFNQHLTYSDYYSINQDVDSTLVIYVSYKSNIQIIVNFFHLPFKKKFVMTLIANL
jgi:hypothetical protein